MKVTNLTVRKLKHGHWYIESEVIDLSGPILNRIDYWDHYTTDLIEVRAICLSFVRREVNHVVKKDSWLHRCRTARPDSLVLSLRWDGARDVSHPAVPSKWDLQRIDLTDDDADSVLAIVEVSRSVPKWHELSFRNALELLNCDDSCDCER